MTLLRVETPTAKWATPGKWSLANSWVYGATTGPGGSSALGNTGGSTLRYGASLGLAYNVPVAERDRYLCAGARMLHTTTAGDTDFAPEILSVGGSTDRYTLIKVGGSTHQIQLRDATSYGTALATSDTNAYVSGAWQYWELEVNVDTNRVRAYVDDQLVIDYSPGGTVNGGNDLNVAFWGGHRNAPVYMRDHYVLNGKGLTNNQRLGAITVEALPVNGDGFHGDWTPSTAGAQYLMIDEGNNSGHDSDTSYVTEDTIGDRSSFSLADLVATSPDVLAVQVNTIARYDSAVADVELFVRTGGVDHDSGDTLTMASSYSIPKPIVWETNPADGSPWSVTEVNTLELGVKFNG